MNTVLIRTALRALAILIAIAAIVDPVFSMATAPNRPVAIVRMTSGAVDAVEQRLRAKLDGRDVNVRDVVDTRLPCGPGERCVIVADGSIDADLPQDLVAAVSLITVPADGVPNVSVDAVAIARGQHVAAAGSARVSLTGRGLAGQQTEVRVTDGAAVVGSAVHEWPSGGSPAAVASTIEIPWWPIETGARTIRIEAVPAEREATVVDNAIDVGVSITADRIPVLVFDPRPSWGSTFVRRALEDDPRFRVEHRARVAPGVSAGTANGRLDARALDAAAVLIVGGLEALTASDVDLIDRFSRVRGGTVVLLPERPPSGASARLFPGAWVEQLTSAAEQIGPLRSTEILRTERAPMAATVLGLLGQSPSIVLAPAGNGRIVVSGAMDAWRFREAGSNAFDRFWRSIVADTGANSAALTLEFDRDLATPGSRARFTLQSRRLEPQTIVEASAVRRCGDEAARSIRLWPAGTMGAFEGEIAVGAGDQCSIEATAGDRTATAAIAVRKSAARGVSATLARLERAVTATGGVIARAGDPSTSLRAGEAAVAAAIMAEPAPAPVVSPAHPMRSAWWMLPFAACLSTEWWLRRRDGLR